MGRNIRRRRSHFSLSLYLLSLSLSLLYSFSRIRIFPEFRLLTICHRTGKTYEFNHYSRIPLIEYADSAFF